MSRRLTYAFLALTSLSLSASGQSLFHSLLGCSGRSPCGVASSYTPVVNASVLFEATAMAHGAGAGAYTTGALDGTGTTLWIVHGAINAGSTFVVTSSPVNTWTACHGPFSNNGRDHWVYYSRVPTTSTTMTVTVTTTSTNGILFGMKGFGGKTPVASPCDGATAVSDPALALPGSWTSNPITTGSAGELILAFNDAENQYSSNISQISVSAPYTLSIGGSIGLDGDGDLNAGLYTAYSVAASPGTYTPTWTSTFSSSVSHGLTAQVSFF